MNKRWLTRPNSVSDSRFDHQTDAFSFPSSRIDSTPEKTLVKSGKLKVLHRTARMEILSSRKKCVILFTLDKAR